MNASKKPLCLLACLGFLLCLPSTALRAGALVTAKGFSFFETGRELIAREKAGIIRPGALVVSAPQVPEAMTMISVISTS